MANRRMFSLSVIDTDKFLDMPVSSQLLYFHLGMRADDDGFVSSPKRIARTTNCGDDDLRILATKGYIIPFESGVVVIRHWRQNNQLRSDRYRETVCKNEKATLSIIDKKVSIVLSSPCQSYQHLDFFLRQIYATQEFQHLFHLLVLIICQSIHFYSPVSFDCTRVKCQIICYRLDIMSKR